MNERIKELAEQAGGHSNYPKFRGHFLPPPDGHIDPCTVDLEKFAELIVAKCVALCKQVHGSEDFIEVNSPEDGAKSARMNIQNYFRNKE